MQKIHPPCHICSTPADFLLSKDGFDEYLCPGCALSFVYPQPEAVWLKEKVYSYESGYQGNKKNNLSSAPIDSRAKKVLDILLKEKPDGGRLLDVGCSSGQFMYWARQRRFLCEGVEINARTAEIAEENGFNVYQGFLENAPFEKKSFDIIYLGDVIEHVNDPRIFMKLCEDLVKDDGIIVVSTPNMDCFWARSALRFYTLFGVPWAPATPPHHLFQFSLNNLSILLAEGGFISTKVLFVKPSSLKYELGSLHLFKKFKQQKNLRSFSFMVFAFGLYSCLYVVNKVNRFVGRKDFQMVAFYNKPV